MNNQNQTIRTFNRFELKYLITIAQAARFKSSLQAYLIPDRHGCDGGTYNVSSLYFDSADLRCYWEKVDGVKFRRKLRIRQYENGKALDEDTPVYVEIKQRIKRVTQKRRVVLPYEDALQLCNQRQAPQQYDPRDKAVIEEIQAFLWQYDLRPANIIRYQRQAFMGSDYDIGLRVTFDTFLTCQANNLDLQEQSTQLRLMSPNWVVMEIKVNERIPYWLTEMIAQHNLSMIHVSKYCRGVEAVNNFTASSRPMVNQSWDLNSSRQTIPGEYRKQYNQFCKSF